MLNLGKRFSIHHYWQFFFERGDAQFWPPQLHQIKRGRNRCGPAARHLRLSPGHQRQLERIYFFSHNKKGASHVPQKNAANQVVLASCQKLFGSLTREISAKFPPRA